MEDVAFPRGGVVDDGEKTKYVRDEDDILFGKKVKKLEPKKKKKKKTSISESVEDLNVSISEDRQQPSIDPLAFKKLCVGFHLLGSVHEIHNHEMLVTLPNALMGYVPITNVNDQLTDSIQKAMDDGNNEPDLLGLSSLFHVGQYIPATVAKIHSEKHGYKKLELSVHPQLVNEGLEFNHITTNMILWGSVSSVEDHGSIISFGSKRFSGFCKNESNDADVSAEGSCGWFRIKKAETKILAVSKCKDLSPESNIITNTDHALSAFRPGQIVKASISKVTEKGILLSISSHFSAIVDLIHLPNNGCDVEELKVKKKCLARLIYVKPSEKLIGASLLDPIVQFNEATHQSVTIGTVCECTVKKVDANMGIVVSIGDEMLSAYCHISRLSDEKMLKISKKYKVGSTHKCRLLSFNAMDSLFQISLQQSVIEQPYLRYHDFHPGQIVQGQVANLSGSGMIVRFGEHLKGLCPTMHLSDIILKHPEKKFIPGKVVKCKVLSVRPTDKHLILTHKKTLVSSTYAPFLSYQDILQGNISHGFIANIMDNGLIIRFYDQVKGFAHSSCLGLQHGESARNVFYVGQVVACKVQKVNVASRDLKLTLNLTHDTSAETSNTLKAGEIIDGHVTSLADNHVVVSTKNNGSALLPLTALSDFECFKKYLKESLTADKITNQSMPHLVAIGSKKSQPILSWRQSQYLAAISDRFVSKLSDLKCDMVVVGCVTHVMSYGLFIEVASGLVGLAPKSSLTEHFISAPGEYYSVGQAVLAKVTEIDNDKNRFLLTLVHTEFSKLTQSDNLIKMLSGNELLQLILSERQRIAETLELKRDGMISFALNMIGTIMKCKVIKKCEDGTEVKSKGFFGFISNQCSKGSSLETGTSINCLVVDFDWLKQRFLAVVCSSAKSGDNNRKTLISNGSQTVTVCHVADDYVVTVFEDQVVYLAAKKNLNDVRTIRHRYMIGQETVVKVVRVFDSYSIAIETSTENAESVAVGSLLAVEIRALKALQLNVALCNSTKTHGRIHVSEILDDVTEGENPLSPYRIGQVVHAKLIGFRDIKSHSALPITHHQLSKVLLDFSLRPSVIDKTKLDHTSCATTHSIGDNVNCFVKSISRLYIWVVIEGNVTGRIHVCHLSTDIEVLSNFKTQFKIGNALKALVIGEDNDHGCFELSCIGDPSKLITVDTIVCGRVASVNENHGVIIELPQHKTGLVHLTNLSDDFQEQPLLPFKIDQMVRCCIIKENADGRLNLSLRKSRLNEESKGKITDPEIRSYDDVKEGSVVRGYIKSAANVGVFVSLAPNICGRTEIKDLSQYFVKNWKPLFPVGKLVTAKIKKLDPSTNHIALSFRSKDTGKPDLAPPPPKRSNISEKHAVEPKKKKQKSNENTQNQSSDEESECVVADVAMASDNEYRSTDDSSDEDIGEGTTSSDPPRLQLSSSFNWNDQTTEDTYQMKEDRESSDSDEEASSATNVSKKTKRQKRAAKKEEEKRLHQAELALIDGVQGPQSAADYDRMLLGSPNSSLLWIQYMAFHLHAAETEKARAVAQRALKTISFREEQEKLNVWVALLNMECTYGTEDEVQSVFRDAVQQNDAKTIYMRMVNIYTRCKKLDLAEKTYRTMAKKFSSSKKVWIGFAYFLISNDRHAETRKLLDRALKCIPNRKHLEIIVKFAMLEFKFGEKQRGITMFESIIKNYPRRTDVWSIYIDAMIKAGDVEQVRNIFERATALSLPVKKAKFFFKRYLDFERKFGDETTAAHVRSKATTYAENSRGGNDT